jgi:uncharacterized phiE125 gp8 family phage protein
MSWRRNNWGNLCLPEATAKLLGPLQLIRPPAGPPVGLAEQKLHSRVDLDVTEDDDLITDQLVAAADYCERTVPGGVQLVSAVYDVPVMAFWQGTLQLPKPPLQRVLSISYFDTTGTPRTVAPSLYQVRTNWRIPGEIELLPYQVWPVPQEMRQWPITVRFECGYGPVTQVANAIAAGQQTVTPDSMDGILVGGLLAVDVGRSREIVQVTAFGPDDDPDAPVEFQATFKRPHAAGVSLGPNLPEAARHAIRMLTGHWYEQREAVIAGTNATQIPMGVDALLETVGSGGYR